MVRIDSLQLYIMIVFSSFMVINTCSAQSSSFEFWPETDVWYRLSPAWRLSCFIPFTKYNESKYRDISVILQADYAWGRTKKPFYSKLMDENREGVMKGWLARAGFLEGWSLGENAGTYTEDMLFAEIHKRVPLKGNFLLSQRLRTDFRWLGNDATFSYRFRYRIMLEKEFTAGRFSTVPFVNAEPYWDSRYAAVNRIRVIGGATLSWGPRLAYEVNMTYQYDSHYDTENLYALNIILHVFFETAKSRVKATTTTYE
jgi:hypothetical protein